LLQMQAKVKATVVNATAVLAALLSLCPAACVAGGCGAAAQARRGAGVLYMHHQPRYASKHHPFAVAMLCASVGLGWGCNPHAPSAQVLP
jgi:hypothetical protein